MLTAASVTPEGIEGKPFYSLCSHIGVTHDLNDVIQESLYEGLFPAWRNFCQLALRTVFAFPIASHSQGGINSFHPPGHNLGNATRSL